MDAQQREAARNRQHPRGMPAPIEPPKALPEGEDPIQRVRKHRERKRKEKNGMPITENTKPDATEKDESDTDGSALLKENASHVPGWFAAPEISQPAEPSGETGIEQTELSTLPRSGKEESIATLLAESFEPSSSSEEEKLNSMSLIDYSSSDLHSVMKHLASKAIEKDRQSVDIQSVNAIVSCASQMTKLLRLKLDVMKALRNQ